ncbi:conserved exported protein of unknown function [Tepidanaerobacter acetatoxydans Re1]|uniref:Uncharacterized protein n=1 Tax=Tepidanaerobacter acetatoxydans (strain DSM 21804 / JCM 16047 / Re1) TaxID=1209989 RepID=F4LV55_TEPAE|nr:hypothetical protein [Tepidanaerobacter acetatoxydans]AEE92702.1 hypothetical protein TepRe1_2604 [Tepidanaerobacter acetatoxydans Re1]CCP27681.1 conserved exported protein of unknown function [Tepidanaerobacter acetatoxydans Re1]
MKKTATVLAMFLAILILFSPSAKADEVKNFIKLTEPKDNYMTSADKVLISGETVPNSKVIVLINGRKEEKELSVGAAGIFVTQAPISSKENIITVKASFPSGEDETVSRKVYQLESGSELPELGSLIQTLKSFLILK